MILEILAGYAIGRATRNKRIRELEDTIAEMETDTYYVIDMYVDE